MNIEECKSLLGWVSLNKLYIDTHNECDYHNIHTAIETLLKAYEKEKRLAEANLKDSEEFKDNMCNHRCILNSKVEELKAELEKEKEKNKELERGNRELNIIRLEYLVSQFPDTTETYKKYKKELDEAISNLKEE